MGPTALGYFEEEKSHDIVEIRTQIILLQSSHYTDYAMPIPHEEEEEEEEEEEKWRKQFSLI